MADQLAGIVPALLAVSDCRASDTVVMPRLLRSSAEIETTGEAVAAAGLRVIEPVTTIVFSSLASAAEALSWAWATPHIMTNAVRQVAPRSAAF